MKGFELVKVKWKDAMVAAGWTSTDDVCEISLADVVTIGYLVDWDEHRVVIANTIGMFEEDCDVNGCIAIPAYWIEDVEWLDDVCAQS